MKGGKLLASIAWVGLVCTLISTPAATKQTLTIDGQVRSMDPSKSVPAQLNYQGHLADAADSSGVTAMLEMTFRIYDSETDGTELWSETHSAVEIADGLFQVLLGSMTTFPASLFDGSPLWLQTEVGTEILVPRKPLVSVAYSRRAEMADHSTTADWATDAQNAAHADSADHCPGVSAWTVAGDDVYRETGKVGIGTTSPLTELDVAGSVNAATYYGDGSNLTGISGTTDNDWTISGDDIYHQMGNVGIGTNNPAAKLEIQGTLNVGQDTSGYDVNLYGSQSGSRLFWDEDKKALRAGWDYSGTSWIPDSIGSCSFAAGFNVIASGAYSVALGHTSTASAVYSTAIGNHTEASGSGSFSRGYKTTASGSQSIAMGAWLTASAPYAIVLGKGESDTSILTNNVANSLMVGFDTATPTLFVGGSNHRVGIGNTSPSYKLDVNGTVNATTYYGDGSNLTGISGTTDNDWTIDGDDVYHETGKVGIGTTSPDRNLHIYDDVNNIAGIKLENVNTEWSSREGITFADEHGEVAGIVTYDDDATNPNSMRIYNNRTGGALTFWTGGLERMRLTNAGEFGIGTTNPAAKLDVSGDVNINSTYKIGGNDVLSISGADNILVGAGAGVNNTGELVTIVGPDAGHDNQGNNNIFIGHNAGYINEGSNNVLLGNEAGMANSTGYSNTFVGKSSGRANTEGYYNTFVGNLSGFQNATGHSNTFLGRTSGYNAVGDSNVFIGFRAGYYETGSNKLYIANGLNDSDVLIYGDFSTRKLGMGTVSPQYKLDVRGDRIQLKEDATGDWISMRTDGDGLDLQFQGGALSVQSPTTGDHILLNPSSGNNVGIGLTAPNRSLYVAENVNGLSYPLKIDNYNGNWNSAVGVLFSTGGDGAPSGVLNTSRGKGAIVYEYTSTWNRGKFHILQNSATDSTNPDLSDAVLTIQNNGNVGIGTTSPTRKFWVNGDAGGSEAWHNDSDERLKQDVTTIESALDKVQRLRGVNFRWRDTKSHPEGMQVGLIAQEVEEVVPEVVEKKGEYYSLATANLVPVLIEAVKEQQKAIEEQATKIADLQAQLDALR